MMNRTQLLAMLMACFMTFGLGSLATATKVNATQIGKYYPHSGKNAGNNVIKIKRRHRSSRIYRPIVPYIAYDYPYYYSRGHYPRHIRGYNFPDYYR